MKTTTVKKLKIAAGCLAAGLAAVTWNVQAADRTWGATPADANWSTGTNWGGTAPGNGDSLIFNASAQTALNNNLAGLSIVNLTFNAAAGAYTIGGNQFTLTGNLTNNSAYAQTINTNVLLGGSGTFGGAKDLMFGGTLSLNGAARTISNGLAAGAQLQIGAVDLSGQTLTLSSGSGNWPVANMTVGNIYSAAGGALTLTNNLISTLTLTGSNSFAGNTTFGNNFNVILDYSANNNAKLGAGTLALQSGTLTLTGGNFQETVSGLNIGNGGNGGNYVRIESTGGGSIFVNGSAAVSRNAAALSLAGEDLLGGTAQVFAMNNGIVASWITINNRDWAYRDATTGMLKAYTAYTTADQSTWATANNVLISADTTVSAARTINTLKITGGTTLTLNGALALGAGGLMYNGNDNYTITGGSLRAIQGGWNCEFEIYQNSTGTLTIASGLTPDGSNNTGLFKAGTGDLVLSGSNSIKGGINVQQGRLIVGGSHALGPNNLASNLGVGNGATLELNGYDVNASFAYNSPNMGTITNSAAQLSTLTIGDPASAAAGYNQNTGALSYLKFDGNLALVVKSAVNGGMYIGTANMLPNTHTGGVTFANAYANAGGAFTDIRVQSPAFFGTGTVTFSDGSFCAYSANPWTWNNDTLVTGNNAIRLNTAVNLRGAWAGDGVMNLFNDATTSQTLNIGGDMTQFSGTLALSVGRAFTGKNFIVELGAAAANRDLSQAAVVLSSNITDGDAGVGTGYLRTQGNNNAVVKIGDLSGGGDVVTPVYSATGRWLVSNNLANSTGTFEVGALGLNSTFSGHLVNETGTLALTKVGAGKWTLDNSNTYTGATTVSGGVLLVGGTGSLTATSVITATTGGEFRYDSNQLLDRKVTVSGGKFSYSGAQDYAGTLAFSTGTIGGTNWGGSLNNLTVDEKTVIAPGNGIGTAVTGVQKWWDGGTFELEIGGVTGSAGADWDLLEIGSLTVDVMIEPFIIKLLDVSLSGFDAAQDYQWDFAHFTALSGFDASVFKVDTAGFLGGAYADTQFTVSMENNALILNYTAIPEPSTWALLLGGAALWLGFGAGRRRHE